MRIMGIIHTRMNITDVCNGIARKGGGEVASFAESKRQK